MDAKTRDLLKRLEWSGEGWGDYACCPECKGMAPGEKLMGSPEGHKPDCALAAALAEPAVNYISTDPDPDAPPVSKGTMAALRAAAQTGRDSDWDAALSSVTHNLLGPERMIGAPAPHVKVTEVVGRLEESCEEQHAHIDHRMLEDFCPPESRGVRSPGGKWRVTVEFWPDTAKEH